ncbi:hypothetical protein H257_17655 [Aphanomyces astaci]|uniref:Uncharacterized protein n=1 Tax=Aphanomyces astaci TaxID=112090 RepID=W4FDW4_APHAT|nr:hypothetical protein H257_17655 [Aphanomyces astaci]ETV65660.1 hypothetical protein H257_17655 [Aphanomyces astaci]|eukprot:XP_009844824.1 hypothetical protein H257_17655 [Aphanomyces astaci]
MHIGYYMDVLQRRQQQGPDGVNILHHQSPDGAPVRRVINSTLFVDDALDIATSYTGIQHRATTSNIFTGIHGSGGVFGAAKSFMIYYSPSGLHYPTVDLNDGLGLPQPVTMAPPMEGFKHLGIQQGFGGTWDITISATWTKLKQDVHRAAACQLTIRQFQYLVNSVWLPRILYRTTLSPAIHVASAFDTLIRRAARRNFRLPYCTPRAFYYDTVHGLGLRACENHSEVARIHAVLRICNTPGSPVYDVMMEALEDWAKRHGLTTHPLAQPAQMKPADTSFLGTTLGLLAKHAATCGVVARWTSPTWQASKRYNDRPILPLLEGQQVGALMVINRRFPWQLRHVGDVCNIDGTYVLDDDTLAVRTGARSPRPATTMGNYVDTPLYGLVLRAVLLTRPNSPDELSYVIGQRTALATRTDASGIQLTITNWHEHRRGSGIWSAPRPHHWRGRTRWEHASNCTPIQIVYSPRRMRTTTVLVWTDSHCGGRTGLNSRNIVLDTYRRDRARIEQAHGAADAGLCTYCSRPPGLNECGRCHRVHHAHCAPAECETAPPSPWQTLHHQSFPTQQGHSSRPITLPAGDGSVLRGGTPTAQGSWAVQHGATIVYGRTYCNPEDLSSTRCESHAIIAGTVLGHDLGPQICDNTSAGAIHRAARRRMLKPWPIRYSHPFRAELRGLMSVMRPSGSFHTVWVRSHQEHEHTTDRQLQAQREALATVDTLATEAHHSDMPSPQTLPIILDTWQLIDHNGRPVMGNTLRWLGNWLATNKWADQQAAYSTDRRTILPTGLETPRTCGWKKGLTRFYWRTIAMTLHTNAAKHRLDGRWGPHCRLCYENPRDTVGHRFGISAPTCSESCHLDSRLGHRLHKTCTMSWLPDQHIYPPRMAQEMAITFDLPLAEAWHENERQRPTQSTTYQPMIMLTGSWHMHGLHLSRLTQLPLASTSAGQLIAQIRWENMQLRAGQYGYITPRWLGRTALSAQPLLAQREIWLAQQMGTEQPATYNGPWDSCSTRKEDAPALGHRFWWIDAILQGRTDQWWRTLATEITTTAAMAGPYEYWCICYKNSTGHRTLDALGATWNLHIPAGQLRMRHHSTITYSSPPRWAGLTNMNKVDILLGFIVSPDSDTSTLPTHWAHALQHWGQMTWLMNPPRNTLPSPPPAYTQAIRWDADNDGDPEDPTCHEVHSWLRASFPHIYRAPAAWQRLPTMTNNTLQWAIALSLTPRLGKDFHRRWFTTHWTTLHAYWTHTCHEQYVATAQDGDTALAQAVNTGIKQRRRAHDDTPAAMDTNLRQAKARRTRDIDTWLGQRAKGLLGSPAASHDQQIVTRTRRRRPLRRPPETSAARHQQL